MKSILAGIVFIAFATQSAFAIPGQTEKQLAAWGKSNGALVGFKGSMDQNTGGTVYMADFKIDGLKAEFSSEPLSGVVPHEFINFDNMPDKWDAGKHLNIVRDTITLVYGAAYAADFANATKVNLHGQTLAWHGKKASYATYGVAIFVISSAAWPEALKNIHTCDGIVCED